MSRYPCARCDHTTDSDDHAATHALDTGHLRCIVCQRQSLTVHQAQTCPGCVARVRLDLTDLVTAYTTISPDGVRAMTLLGDGTMQRHGHDYELRSLHATAHPLARDDENARPKPVRDEWLSDPLPVVAALASWEDFWRADYGDRSGGRATLHGVVSYLTAHLDTGHRAAQTHPAFDEFAAEVRRLRTDVQFAAGLADMPVEAEAECFDCGGPLLRTYAPVGEDVTARRRRGQRCGEALLEPVRRQRIAERSYGIRDLTPWPATAIRTAIRQALAGASGEGLTDNWTCGWCRRVYDQPGYFLALRAAASSWVPLTLAADTARRSVRTVRSWAARGLVTAACRVDDRMVLVWWPDVSDRAFRHAEHAASQRSA